MNFVKPDIIIYHDCCSDGFGCKYVCNKKWSDESILYVPQNFKKEAFTLENLKYDYKNKNILFLDFVYDEEKLINSLEKEANKLFIIDHHQSAFNLYSEKSYAYFNLEKSAAVLTWEALFPEYEVPLLLKYVEDRDLRNFSLPYVNEVLAVLDNDYNMTVEDWDAFSFRLENSFKDVVQKGLKIIKKKEVLIENLAQHSITIEINGVQGLLANAIKWDFASEVAEKLATRSNFGFSWFRSESGEIKCSLRSDNGTNVRELAEHIGGGGHDNSSGATVSIEKIYQLANGQRVLDFGSSVFLDKGLLREKLEKSNNSFAIKKLTR